jgi:hypothetical protein
VGNFDNPQAGFTVRVTHPLGFFLASAFNVRDKPPQHHDFQSRLSGIPFIQSQMFRMFEYIGAFNNYRIKYRFKLRNVIPVTTSDSGTPSPSTSIWRLLPFFSPVGGFLPIVSCAKGTLVMQPSALSHVKVIPLTSS